MAREKGRKTAMSSRVKEGRRGMSGREEKWGRMSGRVGEGGMSARVVEEMSGRVGEDEWQGGGG